MLETFPKVVEGFGENSNEGPLPRFDVVRKLRR